MSTCPDSWFDKEKLNGMLGRIIAKIHSQPNWVIYAMNNFVITVGISYLPLHKEAVKAATQIGTVQVDHGKTSCKTPNAEAYIRKAAEKQRLGCKRKQVRCSL